MAQEGNRNSASKVPYVREPEVYLDNAKRAIITFCKEFSIDKILFSDGDKLEVVFEDCQGAMLPKFYWPPSPRYENVSVGIGRVSIRTKQIQIPHNVIKNVIADEETIARWNDLLEEAALEAAENKLEETAEGYTEADEDLVEGHQEAEGGKANSAASSD